MHAHTHLSHKYINTYIFMYNAYKYIYIYLYIHIYTYMHISRLSYAQLYLHTWTPAHARAHTSAHTHARAHRRRRRAQRPALHRRPAERVPRAVARQPGPKKAAHTFVNVVTAAVFHAPMFALNADAAWNAWEPGHPRSTPSEGARMCRRGCAGAESRTHARAHGRSTWARACGGPPSAIRSSG
jgi:hypothetical protein